MVDGGRKARAPGQAGARPSWRQRLRRSRTLVPAFAVVTVVVAAVTATVMTMQSRHGAGAPAVSASRPGALGAGGGCRDCGVVESAVQLDQRAGYRVRIRMDDGTVRTVEQPAALPVGSRVQVEGGGSLRVIPTPMRQG